MTLTFLQQRLEKWSGKPVLWVAGGGAAFVLCGAVSFFSAL